MVDLREIAEIENLEYFETTSEINGYPANIKGALKGFKTFKEAEVIAKEYDLKIRSFAKKDGWQLWVRGKHSVYEELKVSSLDYGDDYSEYGYNEFETEEEFIKERVEPFLRELENFEDLEEFINIQKKVWEEIVDLEDGQIVITYLNSYFETVNISNMATYFDTNHQVIGLID